MLKLKTIIFKLTSLSIATAFIVALTTLPIIFLNNGLSYKGMPNFLLIIAFYFAAYLPNYFILLFFLITCQLFDHTMITLSLLLVAYIFVCKYRHMVLQNKLSTLISLAILAGLFIILKSFMFLILYDSRLVFWGSFISLISTTLCLPAVEIILNKLLKPFI